MGPGVCFDFVAVFFVELGAEDGVSEADFYADAVGVEEWVVAIAVEDLISRNGYSFEEVK